MATKAAQQAVEPASLCIRQKLAHGGADSKDTAAREPPGEVFWNKAVVREQLRERPERELAVVGWNAAPLVGVAMNEIIPGLFIGP